MEGKWILVGDGNGASERRGRKQDFRRPHEGFTCQEGGKNPRWESRQA